MPGKSRALLSFKSCWTGSSVTATLATGLLAASPSANAGLSFTQIDVPGAAAGSTQAMGINNRQEIVGSFTNALGNTSGFLDDSGSFTQVNVPGASFTQAVGINDAGQIVGSFADGSNDEHGFVDTAGTFTQLDRPVQPARLPPASTTRDRSSGVSPMATASTTFSTKTATSPKSTRPGQPSER